ncbi:MAG: restriction endonuclease subunit S [Candidatus Binatia bacterium]
MNLETFFRKFDLFADAPDAMAKMRGLLIHFAVAGKLVPNDPREEAVDLNLSGVSANNFAVPENWRAGLLGEVFVFEYGDNLPAPKRSESGEYPVFGSNGIVGTHHTYITKEPAIIVGRKGSAGALNIAHGPSWTTDVAYFVRPPNDIDLRFTYYLFSTLGLDDLGKGIKPGLSRKEAYALPIALPPLAEQKRIVAKVDELMGLCDRLEVQQQEREARHAALARASLARFADAPTSTNLNFIFHKSYDIAPADLRKSILTLAVQGKLVPQDPNDEPAEELLAGIESGRSVSAKKQGVRLLKNIPPFGPEIFPHDIPESWQWSRIGNLALVIDYGTSQRADSDSSKVPVYRMGNIVGGRLVDENLKYVAASIDDLPGLYLKTGDILFNRTNSYELVGKAGIFTGRDNTATFASYLIRIRLPSMLLFPKYFSLAMNAPYFRQTQIVPEIIQQCGQANFNGTKLAATVVPVPPFTEQRRIVAKVDELMALVDALETQLPTARTTAEKLMEAVVAELTDQRSTRRMGCPRQSSLQESM